MKQVIRYQCNFCKKEFRTPDRHKCKFRPELRNCFTCKNFNGWNIDGEWGGVFEEPYPDCEYGEDWNLKGIKNIGYNMRCQFWEDKESEDREG